MHLEWTFEKQSKGEFDEHGIKESTLVIPDKQELKSLLKFAEISHITGLQQTLEKIKNADEKFVPFVTKIEPLIENLQFKSFIELVQSYL